MSNQTSTLATRPQMDGSIFIQTPKDLAAARGLKMMLPYGDKLTDDNAYALLIYSRLHRFDPINGECYFLVREKYNDQTREKEREELGCYPGIKGKRKMAKEQSPYKIEYTVVVDVRFLGWNPDDVAICVKGEMRDNASMGEYLDKLITLSAAGWPKDDIERILGKPPVVTGYGAVKRSELRYLKQSPLHVARKRCESDCITQRFDLPIGDEIADDVAPEYSESDEAAAEQAAPTIETKKAPRAESTILRELGFSVPVEEAAVDAEFTESEPSHDPAAQCMTLEQAYEITTIKGTKFGELHTIDIVYIIEHPKEFSDEQVQAATVILPFRQDAPGSSAA